MQVKADEHGASPTSIAVMRLPGNRTVVDCELAELSVGQVPNARVSWIADLRYEALYSQVSAPTPIDPESATKVSMLELDPPSFVRSAPLTAALMERLVGLATLRTTETEPSGERAAMLPRSHVRSVLVPSA